jgi:hypothetical protein
MLEFSVYVTRRYRLLKPAVGLGGRVEYRDIGQQEPERVAAVTAEHARGHAIARAEAALRGEDPSVAWYAVPGPIAAAVRMTAVAGDPTTHVGTDSDGWRLEVSAVRNRKEVES